MGDGNLRSPSADGVAGSAVATSPQTTSPP